jgi:hypothetical protein
LVAATAVRAGLSIRYLDERGASGRVPEFVATDTETGLELSVEAKRRHRHLAFEDVASGKKLGVSHLLADAFSQSQGRPLVVFVDLALPLTAPQRTTQQLARELSDELNEAGARRGPDGTELFNLCLFTNNVLVPGEAPHLGHVTVLPERPSRPVSVRPLARLMRALEQFGTIPSSFDE